MPPSSETRENEIRRWCAAIAASFDPGKTLYLGQSRDAVVQALAAAGVSTCESVADGANCDILLLDPDGLAECLGISQEAFQKQFGKPRQVLVIASTAQAGPSLPEASGWLWAAGYFHDFTAEVWADDQTFISAYACRTEDITAAVEVYEAEWWRQAQTSHKRRLLLNEYMDELVNTLLGAHLSGSPVGSDDGENKRRVLESAQRWEAFQNSRTGKVLRLLQKIRRLGRS